MQRRHLYPLLLGLVALVAACEKTPQEMPLGQFSIKARVEPFSSETKTHLDSERWIYWDLGDSISIGSNQVAEGTAPAKGVLVYTNDPDFDSFNAVFSTTLPANSEYFLGLHPYRSGNQINRASAGSADFKDILIDLPAVQPIDNDTSFAKNVIPMVAWYGGQWTSATTAYNFNFHPLAGIVRLQLFSTAPSSDERTIKQVVVTELDGKAIAGKFEVKNYKTYEPYLQAAAGGVASLTLLPDTAYPMPVKSLHTLYLVMPARGSRTHTEHYKLQITVTDDQDSTITFGCTAENTIPVRRCGITYASAVNLTDWVGHQGQSTLVGNGTAARPFKIYTAADLRLVRDSLNANGTLNGQPLGVQTHYRIMRSDLELTDANWTSSIACFRGQLSYAASGSSSTTPGLTNNSGRALFEDISLGSTVDGLNVIMTEVPATLVPSPGVFSPFAVSNHGTLSNCVFVSTAALDYTSDVPFAGLCTQNWGTIKASGFNATMTFAAGTPAAGVCHTNNGTISGCYMRGTVGGGSTVAGIALNNSDNKTVSDCYFAAHVTSAPAVLGCIVATNNGTVRNSYTGSTSRINAAGQAAGVVHTNNDTVDHCWVESPLFKATQLGGLVHTNAAAAVVLNSWCSGLAMLSSASCHAIAHTNSGSVLNCYSQQVGLDLADGGTVSNSYYLISNTTARLGSDPYTDKGQLLDALNSGATPHAGDGWREWKLQSSWPILN